MKDTTFLKFLAIILVTNSHLDKLYPVSAFATGGSLGNSLFFMVSGLGLALSSRAHSQKRFLDWFLYRIAKLYPPIWGVVFLFDVVLRAKFSVWTMGDYIFNLIYPTSYWFISALVAFYFMVYPLFLPENRKWLPWIFLAIMVPYFFVYFIFLDLSVFSIESGGLFKWLFYFQVMIFGIWLAPLYSDWKQNAEMPKVADYVLLCVVSIVYVCLKLAIAKGCITHWQFLVQWITFPFIYYCLRCCQHSWVEHALSNGFLAPLISVIASATLEIYLLQHHIYTLPLVVSRIFPWNILLFWILLIATAILVHRALQPISKWLIRSKP